MENVMLRKGSLVLDQFIDALSWDDVFERILAWAAAKESRYICICNVHSIVSTKVDPEFKAAVSAADMVTPDGAPIAWMLRKLGFSSQKRINGPDLMWSYFGEAERAGQSVFFYGSTETTLRRLCHAVTLTFPKLRVGGSYSPPFRPLTEEEEHAEVELINCADAQVVFVGLGCPKQEKWMAARRGRINAVMIGVGAAFDYHAGVIERAPAWMQNAGLEWLHRLVSEPRRLWKRYLITNTVFIIGAAKQLWKRRV
jgi:N-acetylglucosaminyldiphosphoundecaprenol N-acetyl-beta-D-mannosaminyltransferase